jgi:hypothetical protein
MKRIYGIETDNIDDDFDYVNCSDSEFMDEAETQGMVWEDLEEFTNQLNSREISQQIIYFRAI